MGPPIPEERPAAVGAWRKNREKFLFLDVRDPDEIGVCAIDGTHHIPLGEFEDRLAEIEAWKDQRIVIHCAKGGRSARACALLRKMGFSEVINLEGGMEAWIREFGHPGGPGS